MRTLLIDNYDSYSLNLFQMLAELNGREPVVVPNDAPWSAIQSQAFDNVVISPGPGHPERERDFGICAEVLRRVDVPVLGVCLGHQGLAHAAGGVVQPAPEPMHGRLSVIHHDDSELFAGVPSPFCAVRYHSLVVATPLPPPLARTAWTPDGLVMAVRHRDRPHHGVQFHPESVCTEDGYRILRNFRDSTVRHRGRVPARRRPSPRSTPSTPPAPPAGRRLRVLARTLPLTADPESIFVHLHGTESTAFWLDSSRVEQGRSRFFFLGAGGGPLSRLVRYDVRSRRVHVLAHGREEVREETLFGYLERELARYVVADAHLPFDFTGGFVGYLGYELKADCGAELTHTASTPDAALLFVDRFVVVDHERDELHAVALSTEEALPEAREWLRTTAGRLAGMREASPPRLGSPTGRMPVRYARERAGYLADVGECRRYLTEGESYEICLTTQLRVDVRTDPLRLYRILRRINPAPHAAFLRFPRFSVLSSSPERFLAVTRDRDVVAKPIKGTAKRAPCPLEDEALACQLRTDGKTRAENLMIVDLLRNDLGRVCEVGTVWVPELMAVESYENVHQLVSTVRGTLRPDAGVVDCLRACFPGGSMTGAPKLRTMELIDRLERGARGIYSGALGFLGVNGTADLSIVIRTIVAHPGHLTIGAGGAIVIQSDAEKEFDEMELKAEPLLRAIRVAAAPVSPPVAASGAER